MAVGRRYYLIEPSLLESAVALKESFHRLGEERDF
jgi:hypothetical protein